MADNPTLRCTTDGCNATFKSTMSKAKHKCKHLLAAVTRTVAKRRREQRELEWSAVKRPRTEPEPSQSSGIGARACSPHRTLSPPLPPPPPPPMGPPPLSTRSGRQIRFRSGYEDFLPSGRSTVLSQWTTVKGPSGPIAPTPEPSPPSSPEGTPAPGSARNSQSPRRRTTVEDDEDSEDEDWFTEPDAFGVFRRFRRLPKHDPETNFTLGSVADSPGLEKDAGPPRKDPKGARKGSLLHSVHWLKRALSARRPMDAPCTDDSHKPRFGPFGDSATCFRLMDWFYGRGSEAEEMLKKWVAEAKVFHPQHGWHESAVHVPMPRTRARYKSVDDTPTYEVRGVHHRDIVDLITGVVSDKHSRFARDYHWVPNKMYWDPPRTASGPAPAAPSPPPESSSPRMPSATPEDGAPPPLRVYTDTYNPDAMLEEEEKVRNMPRVDGDDPDMEYAVLAMLLWSDETVLSQFGYAKLWPIYLYFGNLSKYIRGHPTEFAAHHLAYIPDLGDHFCNEYEREYGKQPTEETRRFCRRELFCRIWLLLMNDKFMKAYTEGIVVMCRDGIKRRLFLRIFTYSADYMEKVKIAALKPNSLHRCARVPEGDCIKDLLKEQSLTPIQNAFSIRLSEHGLNSYQILAPDLMHEFELGVWKKVFEHLIRLIHAQGEDKIKEFNRRMRLMPTWGRDHIRRFYQDASTRKRMAAHDYEAYLTVMMPVIEGLLPLEDDHTVADLLFELSNWHALAKLRMHHTVTLENLAHTTRHMYAAIALFSDTTARDPIPELPAETDKRLRAAQAKAGGAQPGDGARRDVKFNVKDTYKFHSLGDYVEYIKRSGPSDNFTSEVGELEHGHVKGIYDRTNKVNYERQIALQQQHRELVAGLRAADDYVPLSLRRQEAKRAAIAEAEALERSGIAPEKATVSASRTTGKKASRTPVIPTSPADHYYISQSKRSPINIGNWVDKNEADPAIRGFIPRLYEHLAARIFGGNMFTEPEEFSEDQLNGIRIFEDRMYKHKYIRVNYTTYDMRREQDVVSPRNHADIMVPAPEWDAAYPYWYGRVIGIFTVKASYHGPEATRQSRQWRNYPVLWVRWFTRDDTSSFGFQHRRQPCLSFVDATEPDNDPFSFIDPDDVIRAAYILPRPARELNDELLPPSKLARQIGVEPGVPDEVWDYDSYLVSMFADRDMFMRHHGDGIGHREQGVTVEASRKHGLRDGDPALAPHPVPPAADPARATNAVPPAAGEALAPRAVSPGDEPMNLDDPERMNEERVEDDDVEGDDDPDAVARDAAAADENAEEHDPEDLDYERPDEDADEDDEAGEEDGDEGGGAWDSGEDGGSGDEDGDEDGDSGEDEHNIDDIFPTLRRTAQCEAAWDCAWSKTYGVHGPSARTNYEHARSSPRAAEHTCQELSTSISHAQQHFCEVKLQRETASRRLTKAKSEHQWLSRLQAFDPKQFLKEHSQGFGAGFTPINIPCGGKLELPEDIGRARRLRIAGRLISKNAKEVVWAYDSPGPLGCVTLSPTHRFNPKLDRGRGGWEATFDTDREVKEDMEFFYRTHSTWRYLGTYQCVGKANLPLQQVREFADEVRNLVSAYSLGDADLH
ncbi:hypothetical protein C8Q76DRAFT_791844 [Earliella scabrosa]|nr:hypothetical protein C8Q76DRAFT_791844 [Earliella scabrosa]